MKWIGQNIWDQLSRFRNSVYITGEDFHVTSDDSRFISDQANDPLFQIRNEANDATGGRLRFVKTRGADGQDNDVCGTIQFYSYDDGVPSVQNYAEIQGTIHDASAGQESGKLTFGVASHDGAVENGLTLTGGGEDTLVDVTIANGANSTTTIAGGLGVTGDVTFSSDIKVGGGDISGVTDGVLRLSADTSLIFKIDADNDSTDATFQFLNGAATEIANLDESGNLQIDGGLTTGEVTALNSSGQIQVASQPSITTLAGVSAIGTAGTPITITSDTVTFTSANADDPLIKILNTTDDDQGARLFLWKERTDSSIQGGEAGDEIGALYFYGYDNGSNLQGYGKIETFIDVATHGQESGIMQLGVASHDGGFNNGLYMQGGSVDTEVDVTIGTGAASVTTIAGTLTMGSTAAMTNAGLLSVANQSGITGLGTISSGVWNGTAIAHAYIGADAIETDNIADAQVTVAKLHADAIQTSSESYADNDTSLMTSKAIDERINRPTQFIQIQHSSFRDDISTVEHFIPWHSVTENTGGTNENIPFIAPYNGKLKELVYRTSTNTSNATATWKFYSIADKGETHGSSATVLDTQTCTGPTNSGSESDNSVRVTFDGDAVFNAGDILALSITHAPAHSTSNTKFVISTVWEYDISGLGQ